MCCVIANNSFTLGLDNKSKDSYDLFTDVLFWAEGCFNSSIDIDHNTLGSNTDTPQFSEIIL